MQLSPRSLALGILFGLMAGFGLSQWLQAPISSTGGTPALAAPSPTRMRDTAARTTTPLARPRDLAANQPTRASAATDSSPRVSKIALDRAAENLASPGTSEGGFWLNVLVLDETGQPLPGVLVSANPNPPKDRLSPFPGSQGRATQNERAELREAAERIARNRIHARSGHTDANGALRFEGLPQTTWRVNASSEGYLIEQIPKATIHSNSSVAFSAERTVAIAITVLDPEGSMVNEAILQVDTIGSSGQKSRTDEYHWTKGEPFQLTDGAYALRALSLDGLQETQNLRFSRWGSETIPLEIFTGQDPPPLTLQLVPRAGVLGRILQADGAPAKSGASVYALRLNPGQPATPDLLKSEDRHRIRSKEGTYRYLDIDPGMYLLGLSYRSSAGFLVTETVTITDEIVIIDLLIPDPGPDGTLVITTLDPNGQRINVDALQLKVKTAGRSDSNSTLWTRRRSTGVYVIPKPDFAARSSKPNTEFFIVANEARYGTCMSAVSQITGEVTLLFVQPANLEVTVIGIGKQDGQEQFTLTVESLSPTDNPGSSKSQPTDAFGRHLFKGLQPGANRITLKRSSGQRRRRDYSYFGRSPSSIAWIDVTLKSGANQAQINIPPFYSLSVLAPGAKKGQYINLDRNREVVTGRGSQPQSGEKWKQTDASNIATFENILPGSYVVKSNGFHNQAVEIPSAEVTLRKKETVSRKKDG